MSVSKHLMPNEVGSIESYKNELKKCLKENILIKKEINRLKKLKKEQDAQLKAAAKELDDGKSKELLEL